MLGCWPDPLPPCTSPSGCCLRFASSLRRCLASCKQAGHGGRRAGTHGWSACVMVAPCRHAEKGAHVSARPLHSPAASESALRPALHPRGWLQAPRSSSMAACWMAGQQSQLLPGPGPHPAPCWDGRTETWPADWAPPPCRTHRLVVRKLRLQVRLLLLCRSIVALHPQLLRQHKVGQPAGSPESRVRPAKRGQGFAS